MISISSLEASTSNLNIVAGNQLNYTAVTVHNSPSPGYVPPQRVNDAPMDLLASNFTGRVNDLDFILEAFRAVADEDVPTRCVVHGMPGLGKTKLVLRFAQIVFAQLLYSHIFWMSAATPDKLIKGMAKILDLVGHPERTRSEQDAKLTAARLWLEDSQRVDGVQWLLIFDNVDRSSLEFLREHLPRRNVTGNILFTTRFSDVADALVRVAGGRHSILDLRVLDLAEATHLLFSGAGIDASTVTPMQQTQAEELVQNIGCLPLAVGQAASYMRQTNMTLDGMIQVSKGERKIEMIEWESDLAMDQQISVVSTFNTLFDQLSRDFPESYNLLRILSFLDPENIPLAMLTDGARMSLPLLDNPSPDNSPRESRTITGITEQTHNRTSSQHHSENNSSKPSGPTSRELRSLVSLLLSPTAFAKSRHKLQSLSLIEPLSRDGELSLRMHDLVHFMTREHVKRQTAYKRWLWSASFLVCRAFRCVKDPHSPRWWPECEKLLPHIRSLSKWTDVKGVNVALANADVRLARYLDSRGRYGDAEKLCEHSVGSLRKELGDEHQDTLSATYYLAHIYINQGRLTDAAETLDHVLAVRKKELGVDHVHTLGTMNGLAMVYVRQGSHKEAEQLLERVLAVNERKLGPDHPHTLATMATLASGYYSQKRYDKAEELLKHILAHKENLGPDHLDTLKTANNLGIIYQSQTRYVDAENLVTRALVGYERQIGPNHPDTLTTAANLAHLYLLQARNDEAERLYLRVFTGRKQQLGTNHPDTLLSANDLAAFYRSQRRICEADALLDSIEG